MSAISLLSSISLLAAGAVAQFVPAPSGFTHKTGAAGIPVRYKEVPTGICELNPDVKSYAGYSDVGNGHHIFWWFFEARDVNPEEAPLTMWINGGPGSTSMYGLWQELGPCGVDYRGEVYSNPYSWTNVSNMIFIDEPVTVGFSYHDPVDGLYDPDTGEVTPLNGKPCPKNTNKRCGTWSSPSEKGIANTTAAAAPDMWKTLQGFLGAFPQYYKNGFHFATESYGGHYGPVFSQYFEQQNAALPKGAVPISLKSLMVGNGWYDPLVQYIAYYNFTVDPGNTYDYRPFNSSVEAQMKEALYGKGKCVDQEIQCRDHPSDAVCEKADNYCAINVEEVLDIVASRDEYDIREKSDADHVDPFPYGFFETYLNTEKVQQAIGAFVNFSDYSGAVGDRFASTGDDSREDNTVQDMKKLINDGVYVVMYHGDADYNCNWFGGENVSNQINPAGWHHAGYVDLSTSDNIVHGQVRQSENFAFVRIYESGHEVPFYQPVAALEMFERVINNVDVQNGKVKVEKGCSYCTEGTPTSDYREGISTVQMDFLNPNATYNYKTNQPINESHPPPPFLGMTTYGPGYAKRSVPLFRPKSRRSHSL